ncbi:hypothetical protein JY651_35210 [Pyxidicoccus parkwayensis]|uniref:Lipoprotein n=1 Tax=Pyxidicoccus parkwayensis TaxID=2813578 RepID=A0ABX7NSS7_9BACT|nr:hypothetical protein [Pyxidicoccus parkwaysis]QSQ20464.1 hypothetical protein JY651_35210 [Pyxidicoccus parkwaysis]
MHMKMAGRLLATTLLSLSVGCQDEGGGAWDERPLQTREAKTEARCIGRFEGIETCATGNATVSESEQGVNVSGVSAPETDGVSSNFAGAIGWSQRSTLPASGMKQLALAARDGDQVISTLKVSPGETEDLLILQPGFTGTAGGSHYQVRVYQDGTLVGTATHAPLEEVAVKRKRPWYWWLINFTGTWNQRADEPRSDGACVWGLEAGEDAFSVELDGVEVGGNELYLVEVIGSGHYPYTTFSGIDVTGEAGDFTILSESIRRE